MNAVWDTPEFWARSEADEIVRDMPEVLPGQLADSLETSAASCDGAPEFVALIVADLRRRATASLRFWPAPELHHGAGGTSVDAKLADDDDIPW